MQPYWKQIQVLLSYSREIAPAEFDQALSIAIEQGKNYNLPLLGLMNDLTVDLENVARSKATRLRLIQTVGISLAIINFFIIMFHFLKQLRQSDKKIAAAQQETQEILETVNEGLFLVDKDLVLGEQHSEAIEEIFERRDIVGITIDDLLGKIISKKDLATAKDFVTLLFKPDIKQTIKDLTTK